MVGELVSFRPTAQAASQACRFPLRYVVVGPQRRLNCSSVGLRPRFVSGHIRVQLAEVKRGVDFFIFYMMFNLSKLFSESFAILVVLLNGAHALSLLLSD